MHSVTAWITTIVFSLTYAGLAFGKIPGLRVDRAAIAFVGAALVLCMGLLTLPQAVAVDSIDYETLALLFGMMVVVGFLRICGFFVRLTNFCLSRIRTPQGLLAAVIVLSGLLSAFLVNDVVCVAITPLILHLVKKLRFDPIPQLIGVATAANIGSVGTITGNPQNMIIGIQSHIAYLNFAAHLMPLALAGLAIDFLVIRRIYKNRLRENSSDVTANAEAAPAARLPGQLSTSTAPAQAAVPNRRVHRWLQRKSALVCMATIALFFCGFPIALVALGAAAILLLDRIDSHKIYRQVDWSLLLLFGSLFVVVHAFQVNVVSGWSIDQWTWLKDNPIALLSAACAVLSNLVSNVPAVLLFEPIMHTIPAAIQSNAWLALAMSSTFAGNLTLLGSVANLIVVESARRDGVTISFWEYCRAGIPVTLITLALGVLWLQFVRW